MKKYSLLALFTVVIVMVVSAQPVIKEQRAIGGSYIDVCSSINSTNDGGFIVGGSSYSNISGEKTENSRGSYDYWIVKLDSTGKIEWDKTIGGDQFENLASAIQTSDGGYVLGGTSDSNISGEKTENNRENSNDYWIVKLDHAGKVEWNKTIGGNKSDWLNSIQQTTDGGYILGGDSYSEISGEKTENNRGWGPNATTDYWIVKLDSTGKIEWDKTIGGREWDYLNTLQQTDDGGYMLGGGSSSNISAQKTENNRGCCGYADYWIVKLNARGKIEWDKTIGGSYEDQLTSLQQTKDGGYILGGLSNSNISGEKTENSRENSNDYWIVKLDSTGIIEYDKTIGGNDNEALYSIRQTSDHGYILGGYSYSNNSFEKTENNRSTQWTPDCWIVKLNPKGKVQWDKTIGGDTWDVCKSVMETGKNRYVMGGWSESDISGDKTKKTRGSTDYWIVSLFNNKTNELPETASLNATEIIRPRPVRKNITIYPNPVKDILHIINNGKATITLTDQSGKTIFTKRINGSEEINVSHLPAGLYYLKNNNTGIVQKIIVTK